MLKFARIALAVFFVVAGLNHFISPSPYLAIMPPFLPWPLALVYLSGIGEIAGGIAVLVPAMRKLAGVGLIGLLVAVFPANIYAALHGMELGGSAVPPALLWLRLPLQALLIAWVYFACWKERNPSR